jgi:hypothetical protein
LQTAAGDVATLHFPNIIQTTKMQDTAHSTHSSHDHNYTTLDTGRYCRPSTQPGKEAMLGDVTDHQAAETNK